MKGFIMEVSIDMFEGCSRYVPSRLSERPLLLRLPNLNLG